MTFRELCAKEVVQLSNGACLGRADDLELDPQTAQVRSLLLLGRPHLFGLLGRAAGSKTSVAHAIVDAAQSLRER